MGAADDIKKGLTKNLANFTKQRKAEEKHSGAVRWRTSRIMEVRGMYLTEAANEVMRECYMKASDNNRLPATARQIFYVARPLIEEQTDKPLSYKYFSQTLLPNYINEHAECADWDVVYDDRGHFREPHTELVIGIGTLNVRDYVSRISRLKLKNADFNPAGITTHGPHGSFGAVLYVEKEGFLPLFERVNLAKRYDIAIMSSKGMSVTAARTLVDSICGRTGIPLLVLHDFDSAGIIIKDTLEKDTRRYSYNRTPDVIDLGLQYDDIAHLTPEPNVSTISDERLAEAGLDDAAITFLRSKRVELNAMTSRQLVDFVEGKLKQHGIRKIIPDRETLALTHEMFAASDRLYEAFNEMRERLDAESEEQITVPTDLAAKVEAELEKHPDITWHRAIRQIVDPNASEDADDDEDGGELDDEDLDDVDD
jgi:hypothetical protein